MSTESTPLVGNRWRPTARDVAARLTAADLQGALQNELIVEPGQDVILVHDGHTALAGQPAGPGAHALQTLWERFTRLIASRAAERVVAYLYRTTPIELPFEFPTLYTADPLHLQLQVRLHVRIADPNRLVQSGFSGRSALVVDDLAADLGPDLQNVIGDWMDKRRATELEHLTNPQRTLLQTAVEAALQELLWTRGLTLETLRVPVLQVFGMEQLRRAQAEIALDQLLFDARYNAERQQLAQQTRQIEMEELRSALLHRMQRVVLSREFDALQSEADRQAFVARLDTRRLLREEEHEQLRRAVAWRREQAEWQHAADLVDRDRDRAFLLAQIDLLQSRRLEQLAGPLRLEQARHQLQLAALQQEAELARRRAQDAYGREQEAEDAALRRRLELEDERQKLLLATERLAQTEQQLRLREMEQAIARSDAELRAAAEAVARRQRAYDDIEITRRKMALELERQQAEIDLRRRAAEAGVHYSAVRVIQTFVSHEVEVTGPRYGYDKPLCSKCAEPLPAGAVRCPNCRHPVAR